MIHIFLCTENGELIETHETAAVKNALATGSHRIWVDFDGPNEEEIELLSSVFHFNELAIEQVIQGEGVPKIEVYEDFIFLVLHRVFYHFEKEECERREFQVFFGDKFIVTVHTPQLSRTFAMARKLVRGSPKDLLGKGTSFVLLKLLSLAIKDYQPVMEEWQDTLDNVEQEVLRGTEKNFLDQILKFKKLVAVMRKSLLPEREVIQQIHERTNHSFLTPEARRRFHNVMHEWGALLHELDNLKEHAASVFEVYVAMLTIKMTESSNKLNFVMQRLTIAATIFLPLTFIVGVYGMNFNYMPEFHWKGFYYILWGLMIGLVVGMIAFFKKKKWL